MDPEDRTMWTSPTTNLRLAADRQDDFHRAADLERRSRRGADTNLRSGWRAVIGRLVAMLPVAPRSLSRW